MAQALKIVLAQLNFLVGDIDGNLEKHLKAAAKARDELGADIIVFPELSLTGYLAQDLFLRRGFLHDAENALAAFISQMKDIYCVIGHPKISEHGLLNACSIIYNGKIVGDYAKQRLPNYGVFDECRYFVPGTSSCVLPIKDLALGFIICEDLWKIEPTKDAAQHGAKLIIVPNASPFEINKHEQRLALLEKRAKADKLGIVYANHVGGQDEIVFDGGSMVVDAKGELQAFAGFFKETLLSVTLATNQTALHLSIPKPVARIYDALVLGVRDYISKNQISGVLLGLSGGIDSALTLAIAVDALGKDRVHAVLMPSRYTADISMEDANSMVKTFGVSAETISIEPAYESFLKTMAPSFAGKKPDVTEENIQARIRAMILMALSNQTGRLVLTTGNRSELAVGYCTLYGDMAGGYAPLKDVPKTLVYELSRYRNELSPVIPERIIHRAPSAELASNQKDEDTLPPYAILDEILEHYLNQGLSAEEIIALGFEKATVEKVINLIRKNEYKRSQAAIGPHINHKSFGKDWRYPLTDGYKK